ncbi:hypothetical protein [Nocardia brevicatena]|uniref:hypothetical protein n=1 Tax=Nocardia brevicatena TaxID=37327 RepID=UPI0002F76BF7|nr:hypothetical protein [Nocardia brevicatena]
MRSANAKFGVSESVAQFIGPVAGGWFFATIGGHASLAVAITMVALLTVVLRLIRVDEEPFPHVRRQ